MYLNISNFNLKFDKPISIVIGDSSTGKTTILEDINRDIDFETDASEVIIQMTSTTLNSCPSGALILLDESDRFYNKNFQYLLQNTRSDLNVVIFGRKRIKELPIPTTAVYKLITVKGITKNIPYCDSELINIGKFKTLITEDSMSGYHFFSKCFSNCRSSYGNSGVIKNLSQEEIVLFDSLGFGGYLTDLLDEVKKNPKLLYVAYRSFEAFLLEEIFNMDIDDKVLNPEVKSFNKLKERVPEYSKSCINISRLLNKSELRILKNSSLSFLLDYYINEIYTDVVEEELHKLRINEEDFTKIRELLPTASLPEDMLRQAVRSAVEMLGL